MTDHTYLESAAALKRHLDRRTLADVVSDVRLVQAALMNASPSGRVEKALKRRLSHLVAELSARTGGTLTAGPL